MDVTTAAALERARAAVEALGETPPVFVKGMQAALEKAEAALKEEPRGRWPGWPDKRDYLGKLPAGDERLRLREEAYNALEHLKKVAFAPVPEAERQRNVRQRKADGRAAAEAAGAEDEPMPDAGAAGAFACRPRPAQSHPAPRHKRFLGPLAAL